MAPHLILIPGTMCDQRLFAAVARRLRPEVAVQVARWRELLGTAPPAWWHDGRPLNLLGFSLGGIWALQRLGLRQTDPAQAPTIQRLALLGSNADPAGPAIIRRSREQRWLLARRGTTALARAVKARYFASRPHRWQAQLVLDMARRTPRGMARRQIKLAAGRSDGLHALANFQGPVAVWAGRQDGLCPAPQQQRMRQARADAISHTWSGCGHMIPLEAPGRLAIAIRRWLSQPLSPLEPIAGVPKR